MSQFLEENRDLLSMMMEEEGMETHAAPAGIPKRPEAAQRPLSFSQERLWMLDQIQPGSVIYNVPLSLRMKGDLNVSALRHAIRDLLERHEVLRSRFRNVEGKPLQELIPTPPDPLPQVDLSSTPENTREAALLELVQQETLRPFELSVSPLLRTLCIRVGPKDHVLVMIIHHIASDAWSIDLLLRELSELYRAHRLGQPASLPPLPIQYADYAAWQRTRLTDDTVRPELDFWHKALNGGNLPVLELPTDRPRPPIETYDGDHVHIALSPELTQRVRQFSADTGVTPFMTLLANFSLLLHRYSGQADFAIATPVSGRHRPEIEPLIGFFLNTLILRIQVPQEPTFQQFLTATKQTVLQAFSHQELPFERLVTHLQPTRDLSRSVLFQVMMTMNDNYTEQAAQFDNLDVEAVRVSTSTSKFDLTLSVLNEPNRLVLTMEFNRNLFNGSTIQRMLACYQRLLGQVIQDPSRPIGEYDLVDEAQRQKLASFNATYKDYDLTQSLHGLIGKQAHKTPQAVAVADDQGELTYRELELRASALAQVLKQRGVKKGDLVGVCLERSLDLEVALLAVIKAQGAYVPLEPSYPAARLEFMLQDSQVQCLLAHAATLPVLNKLQGLASDILLQVDDPALYASKDARPALVQALATATPDLAYMIYTSGSTGQPKGAINHHTGIVNRLLWMQETFQLTSQDVILQKTPAGFDVSVWEFFWPLLAGAKLFMAKPGGHQDPAYLVQVILKQKITTLHFVPSMLQAFLEMPEASKCNHRLKRVICSGEALGYELKERFFQLLPNVELHNLYGPTEAAVDVTHHVCKPSSSKKVPAGKEAQDSLERGEAPIVPIGHPIANTQIHILDTRLRPVPLGVPGELYIGGVQVAKGYLKRPELTAERFIVDPFREKEHGRLYKSGDLARWLENGEIEFLGRLDFQVKIRGQRIELGEIEQALVSLKDLPQDVATIRQAVVIARGQAQSQQLVAYLVLEKDTAAGSSAKSAPSIAQLRQALAKRLPEAMIPAHFVFLNTLPLSPNGKVDRKALPEPKTDRAQLQQTYIAPRNPLESALATIWQEVLKLPQIGIQDNFFALGGDSILSLQIIARAQAAGMKLTPRDMFQRQTIGQLAEGVVQTTAATAEQGPVVGEAALLPIQKWLLSLELPEADHFNQAMMLRATRPVVPEILRNALKALQEHHDALRLRVWKEGEIWKQEIAKPEMAQIPLSFFDLSKIPAEKRKEAIEAAATDAQASLNRKQGKVWQSVLFDDQRELPLLLIAIHHLAVDGVSWRVLLEDLQTAYVQLEKGQAVVLPAKTASIKAWGKAIGDYARSPELLAEAAYWKQIVAPRPVPLDLPEGRKMNRVTSSDSVSVRLEQGLTRRLLQEAGEAYHTRINDLLLTALAMAWKKWTHLPRVLLHLEGHGREHFAESPDVSRTVGWFTSLFPVELTLSAKADIGSDLIGVKEQLRAIPNNGLGYGVLRYVSDAPAASLLTQTPAPEICFNYLGQIDTEFSGGLFALAQEPTGPSHGLKNIRPWLLELNASVMEGSLILHVIFSKAAHNKNTMEMFARNYLAALTEIIEHCTKQNAARHTPSDFKLSGLNQGDLDQLAGLLE